MKIKNIFLISLFSILTVATFSSCTNKKNNGSIVSSNLASSVENSDKEPTSLNSSIQESSNIEISSDSVLSSESTSNEKVSSQESSFEEDSSKPSNDSSNHISSEDISSEISSEFDSSSIESSDSSISKDYEYGVRIGEGDTIVLIKNETESLPNGVEKEFYIEDISLNEGDVLNFYYSNELLTNISAEENFENNVVGNNEITVVKGVESANLYLKYYSDGTYLVWLTGNEFERITIQFTLPNWGDSILENPKVYYWGEDNNSNFVSNIVVWGPEGINDNQGSMILVEEGVYTFKVPHLNDLNFIILFYQDGVVKQSVDTSLPEEFTSELYLSVKDGDWTSDGKFYCDFN